MARASVICATHQIIQERREALHNMLQTLGQYPLPHKRQAQKGAEKLEHVVHSIVVAGLYIEQSLTLLVAALVSGSVDHPVARNPARNFFIDIC